MMDCTEQNTKPSVFLLGGSFLTRLETELPFCIAGKRIGPSPLSRYALSADGKQMTAWRRELDILLSGAKADYLILDLQRAESMLFSYQKERYTLPENGDTAATGQKRVYLVDPYRLRQRKIERDLEKLAAVLKRHFQPYQIILLHTHRPDFWLGGNSLHFLDQDVVKYTSAQIDWLNQLEKLFCEITSCRFLDVSRFYFYRKDIGRPLTNVIYEDECYQDTSRRLSEMLRDPADTGATKAPDFSLSLQRYANYRETLYQKAFPRFLDPSRFPERLILASGRDFVIRYMDELIRLNSFSWDDIPAELDQAAEKFRHSDLPAILRAFYAVEAGRPELCSAEDCARMFSAGVVPEQTISVLREQAESLSILPEQINRWNAGLYFARLHGMKEDLFRTAKTVEQPYLIDIFGSCVSRTGFNIKDNDTAILHYWFHVPPFEGSNPAVSYPDTLFPETLVWQDRLVKAQLDRRIHSQIRESAARWLIVDFYSLAAADMFLYQGVIYTDFRKQLSKKLGSKPAPIFRDASICGDLDEIMERMNGWCDAVKEKYGDHIILINALRSEYWRGDNGMIHRLPKPLPHNEITQRAYEHVSDRLNCYAISVADQFMPDDTAYMRRVPSHTEDLCYCYYHDLCIKIMREQPARKRYEDVPGEIRVAHILRFSEKNTESAMRLFFHHHPLDDLLLRMPHEYIRKFSAELAALYEMDHRSFVASLSKKGQMNEELRKLLKEAVGKPSPAAEEEVSLPTAYRGYSPEDGIFSGRSGLYPLPAMPQARLRVPRSENGAVTVNWQWIGKIKKGSSIWLYRKCDEQPWESIAVLSGIPEPYIDRIDAAGHTLQYGLRSVLAVKGIEYVDQLGGIVALPSES